MKSDWSAKTQLSASFARPFPPCARSAGTEGRSVHTTLKAVAKVGITHEHCLQFQKTNTLIILFQPCSVVVSVNVEVATRTVGLLAV